jgi:ComEC/Rec2-related protein
MGTISHIISRPLVPLAVVWIAGMTTAVFAFDLQAWWGLSSQWFLIFWVGVLGLVFSGLGIRREKRGWGGFVWPSMGVYGIAFIVASAWCFLFGIRPAMQQGLPASFYHHLCTLEAEVMSSPTPVQDHKTYQIKIQTQWIAVNTRIHKRVNGVVKVSSSSFSRLPIQIGQVIQVTGILNPVVPQHSKFDIWGPIRKQRDVQFVLDLKPQTKVANTKMSASPVRILPGSMPLRIQIRNLILNKIEDITSKADRVFLQGLLFGITDALEPDLREAYTLLGISHILAISGMNIELLIRPCMWMLRVLRVRNRLAVIVTACLIVGYGKLTEGGPSVDRAVIMGVVMLGAHLFRRKADPLSALSFSTILCLLIDPTNLGNVGFHFSFLASLFLILFSTYLTAVFRNLRVPASSALAVYVAATAATLPIQLYVFRLWSPESLFLNLLLEPLLPVGMVCSFMAALASFLWLPLATVLGLWLHGFVWMMTVPAKWLYDHGILVLQVDVTEAVWSYLIYGMMGIVLFWNEARIWVRKRCTLYTDGEFGKNSNNPSPLETHRKESEPH